MRGALQVMKHMDEDGDMEAKKKMDAIAEDLKLKEEELDHMEELNQTLIVKERKTNDELQEARKELITVCHPTPTSFLVYFFNCYIKFSFQWIFLVVDYQWPL